MIRPTPTPPLFPYTTLFRSRRQLGLVFATQANIDGAIIEFRRAIALRPTSPAPYSAMGVALMNAARYEEAVNVLSDAATRFPDNVQVYQRLGTAYQFLGNTDEAIANYRKAIAIRPSAPAYSNIGAKIGRASCRERV